MVLRLKRQTSFLIYLSVRFAKSGVRCSQINLSANRDCEASVITERDTWGELPDNAVSLDSRQRQGEP